MQDGSSNLPASTKGRCEIGDVRRPPVRAAFLVLPSAVRPQLFAQILRRIVTAEAGQAPCAEAVTAVVADLLQHDEALAVFVADDLVSQEAAFVADAFEASQARAALAHQAVAAMERARSRNSFMSNLPEGWNGSDLAPPSTPEASACARGSLLVVLVAGVSEVQKLPDSRAGTIARVRARRLVDAMVSAP